MKETDVVVVGGGPVGTGLAIELGQRGVNVVLIERYPTVQMVPKGQNLTQRTMEHFQGWGLEAALRAARTVPDEVGIQGLTAYRTLLGDYQHDWLRRELVGAYYFAKNERIPQYETEAVLRERVAQLPSVQVVYGWEAMALEQRDDGVQVSIRERDGDGEEVIAARFVIGCDGSRSVTREQAGITQTMVDHGRTMALLVFRSRALTELLGARYPGKSFFNVIHPDFEGYWLFFGRVGMNDDWFFHAPVPPEAQQGRFDFEAFLIRAAGAKIDVAIDYVGFWDLRFAIADQYRSGNIFVAGDAAHSHPPYGGYGINSGFEDARNLGWKLAAVLAGWGGPALLDSYDQERRGVFISTARDFIAQAIETDRDFLTAYDPMKDRAAFEKAWEARSNVARADVGGFQPNYRGSDIVDGSRDGACDARQEHSFVARAGFHLAPAVLPSGRNTFETLGEGFTLLDFHDDGTARQHIALAAAEWRVPLKIVSEPYSGDATRYGNRLILVRPDQFVAWAADEAPGDAIDMIGRAVGKSSTPKA